MSAAPTLAQYLGDGARAAGYEEWLVENVLVHQVVEGDADKQRFARLVMLMAVAAVEGLRMEEEQHGPCDGLEVLSLAQAAGYAVFCAAMSGMRDDLSAADVDQIGRFVVQAFSELVGQCVAHTVTLNANEGT